MPRDRSGEFSTAPFERYARSEKALVAAPTEMYVQGVSTRKVKASMRPRAAGTSTYQRRGAIYDYLAQYDTHLVCWYNNATGIFVLRQAAADGEVAEQD